MLKYSFIIAVLCDIIESQNYCKGDKTMKNTFKKTVSLILALMMLFSCLALGASAKGEAAVSFGFSPDKESYSYGDTAVFTVTVENKTDETKSFTINVDPKHDRFFSGRDSFTVRGVAPNTTRTAYYSMRIEEPARADLFELISRLIDSIRFIFTKFDYKETIKVEGRNRPVGFNVKEIEVISTPAPDIDATEIEMSPAEIAAEYNRAVNALKNYNGNATVNKLEDVTVEITDCPGGAVVKNIVQPVVDSFVGTVQREYVFENGENEDGRTLDSVVAPFGRKASLVADALASAKAYEGKDDNRFLCFVIADELSFFDGTTTISPIYHESILDTLNLTTLDMSPIEITQAEMYYRGATVTAVIDSQGRLTALQHILPIDGACTGKAAFISATVGLAGSMTTDWAIEYK